MTRIALLQMTSSTELAENAGVLVAAIEEAAQGGAEMLFTPEMSGLLDRDRMRAAASIACESDDPVLAAVRQAARDRAMWVALGSLAVRTDGERWANRSFLVGPDGAIKARYDKIHMFDVALDSGEAWQESKAYRPGEAVVTAEAPIGRLGLSICYDVRFPALFEELGRQGCDAIAVPAAFTVPTGQAHWHLLLRTRAVEASAYVIAAAQVGEHLDGRRTYGHSLVVDPWGEVLLDLGGEESGLGFAEIEKDRIEKVRRQLPSLANRRNIPKSPAQ